MQEQRIYKTKVLLSISPTINVDVDPTFFEYLQRVFVWANEMGLKGQKVSPFWVEKGSEVPFTHPNNERHRIMVNYWENGVQK